VPLIALRQDLLRYYNALGVRFAVWDAVTNERRVVGCPLLFVMMKMAVIILFHVFLARVILDEAHLVLMSSRYQPKIRLIQQLRNLRAQFVFLRNVVDILDVPTEPVAVDADRNPVGNVLERSVSCR
jgi:hypothetical protein